MKWKKKIRYNPVITFFVYFVLFTLLTHATSWKEQSFLDSVLDGLFFAVFMTFFLIFFFHPLLPVYFKLGFHDKLVDELKKEGAVFVKEKEDKLYFKVKSRKFPFNRIRVKKTPFYACLEVPERDHDYYLKWIDEKGAGLYEKKV